MPRTAAIHRKTNETDIHLKLNLDGRGSAHVATGIRFFDHMLELFARHGGFDLRVKARGDLDVDQHHTVEDVGIAFGEAVAGALGTRRGINRAGYFVMPMDETLAVAAIDLGGRPHAVVDLRLKVRRVGDLQSELVQDFFEGFARGSSRRWSAACRSSVSAWASNTSSKEAMKRRTLPDLACSRGAAGCCRRP